MRSLSSIARKQVLSPFFALYLMAIYLLILAPLRPEILSTRNLMNVAISSMPLVLLAVGQTFALATAGIDLSITAVVSFASVVGALVMTGGATSGESTGVIVLGTATMLGIGLLVGLAHGVCISALKMPPLLVTLVSLIFLEGLAELVTRSKPVGNLPEGFVDLHYESVLGIPLPIATVIVVTVLAHVALRHTLFGRRLLAVGQNYATARLAGLPVRRTITLAYMVSSLLAAIAGVLYMIRLEAGTPALASESVLLDCIAATVIGGTSLTGGKATIVGSVLGALFLTLVDSGLQLVGSLQIWHVFLIKGGIILLATGLESMRSRIAYQEGLSID